jgi:glycosyltransferase involved in cell wall biosynthesis
MRAAACGIAHRIYFTGFRQDVPRILASVDCVCIPSLSEALPYTLLEAAAWARPILATSVGGMATLLEDRNTALLVPPGDPAALAEGLRWMAQHPDEAGRIGMAAYELVRQSFSLEAMIEKTLQVYDAACQ